MMSANINAKKILMFGKKGLVSFRLAELFGDAITVLGSDQVDFSHNDQIVRVLDQYKPNLIINAAAYTKVDLAEDEPELAYQINGYALKTIGDWAKANQAHVIHFSTDYVFNGQNSQGYKEDHSTDPVNVYGSSKLLGEKLLQESGAQNSIFRISWIYDDRGTNFYMTMRKLMSEREEISVVNDQHGMPTPAKWVAQKIYDFITQGTLKPGLFHLVPPGCMTWYDFAEKIKTDLGFKTKINPIPSSQYKTKAKRPTWSKLISTRL